MTKPGIAGYEILKAKRKAASANKAPAKTAPKKAPAAKKK